MIIYVQKKPDCLIVVAKQICRSGLSYIFKDYGAYGPVKINKIVVHIADQ
jgi:hypothetical protein